MTKQGYIELTPNEVIFVYHELPEPERNNYYGHGFVDFETVPVFNELAYYIIVQEYEASKRSVKVSNVVEHLIPCLDRKDIYRYYDVIFGKNNFEQIKDKQVCMAEIENNKAKITKIL